MDEKRGFLSWLSWQLCDWRGQSSRRDFFWGALCGVFLYAVYTLLAYQVYVEFVPQFNGQPLTVRFLIENRNMGIVPQWAFLPMCLPVVALAAKRLRDIGLSAFIAPLVVLIDLALQFLFQILAAQRQALGTAAGAVFTGWGWALMLYCALLLMAPTNATQGYRAPAMVWAAIGTGGPHDMTGRVRSWKVVKKKKRGR